MRFALGLSSSPYNENTVLLQFNCRNKGISEPMNEYKTLNEIAQLDEIDRLSHTKAQVIFKHSTRCSVSTMAKRGLDMDLKQAYGQQFDIYYLDLIAYRNVSNNIATRYNVEHESPQILVIKNGKCVFDASHSDVSLEDALKA